MPLNFPQVLDIPLRQPPLEEVICQVRFPPLLKITDQLPSSFQDQIRRRFPQFQTQQGIVLKFESGNSDKGFELNRSANMFSFATDDGTTVSTLGNDFYSLKTTVYTIWDDFYADLALVHQAVIDTYDPAFASRIGLRYVNKFTVEGCGVADQHELIALFRPELTSLLTTDAWSGLEEMVAQVSVPDGDANLALRFGVLPGSEQGCFLDLDYYIDERSDLDSVLVRASAFHDAVYRAFRWAFDVEAVPAFVPEPRG